MAITGLENVPAVQSVTSVEAEAASRVETAAGSAAAGTVVPPVGAGSAPNGSGSGATPDGFAGGPSGDPFAEASEVIDGIVGGFTAGGELEILLDEETDRFIYQAIDTETGEVIRQFPPEEILRVVRAVREIEGLVLDESA